LPTYHVAPESCFGLHVQVRSSLWLGGPTQQAFIAAVMLMLMVCEVQVEAEKREIETEEHLKIMADKEIVSLAAAASVQSDASAAKQLVCIEAARKTNSCWISSCRTCTVVVFAAPQLAGA
jgi:hypothetical protein